jgi:hypothetical protein
LRPRQALRFELASIKITDVVKAEKVVAQFGGIQLFGAKVKNFAVRPEGAFHRWREVPPRELSIGLVADERFGRVTRWTEAS